MSLQLLHAGPAKANRVRPWLLALGIVSAWAMGIAGQVQAAGPLAIQGAKIITITGDAIENGTILIRDGKIVAVGTNVKIPSEAKVIDAAGKVVMPGYIDAHNAAGMSQANEQNSLVPFLSVVDSIDPIAAYFQECRRNGITTAAVVPGNSTLIGGKAAIVKTAGQYVDDMLLRRDSALKLSMRPTSGSRMTQLTKLRKELDRATKALKKEAEKEVEAAKEAAKEKPDADKKNESGDKATAAADEKKPAEEKKTEEKKAPTTTVDRGLDALKAAVEGKMPVYIYCDVAMDVVAAVKLVQQYGLKPIYVLGRDCHEAAELLADLDAPVIVGPSLVYWETNPRTREDQQIILPKKYDEAGVQFIFQLGDPGRQRTLGSSYLWFQAATAVKYGKSKADALAAMTIEPAKLLGIDNLVGSIEVGKDADLVILTGEPLDITTWVDQTIQAGEVVYNRADDEKLKRLLAPVAE